MGLHAATVDAYWPARKLLCVPCPWSLIPGPWSSPYSQTLIREADLHAAAVARAEDAGA